MTGTTERAEAKVARAIYAAGFEQGFEGRTPSTCPRGWRAYFEEGLEHGDTARMLGQEPQQAEAECWARVQTYMVP